MTLPSLLPQVRREIEAAAAEEGPAPPPAQEDLDRLAARNERFLQEKTSAPAHFARKQARPQLHGGAPLPSVVECATLVVSVVL